MVSLSDIAKEAGVSRSTVSRVLSNDVDYRRKTFSERAEKIKAIAKKMNYRPMMAARTLKSNCTQSVGIIMADSVNCSAFFMHPNVFEAITSFSQAMMQKGYLSSLVGIEKNNHKTCIFNSRMLDGVAIIGSIPDDLAEQINKMNIPIINVASDVWNNHNCIRFDEYMAGFETIKEVAEAGYKNILYLTTSKDSDFWGQLRRKGICEAAVKFNIDVKEKLCQLQSEDFSSIKELLQNKCAVVTENAYFTHWLLAQCAVNGVHVGKDFPLISCEGSLQTERHCSQLTHVHFDRMQLGKMAANMLVRTMQEGEIPSEIVTCKMIKGSTL